MLCFPSLNILDLNLAWLHIIKILIRNLIKNFIKAYPIGESLGGYVLVRKSMFQSGEIRNYTLVFLIALIFEIIAFLWIMFMINEKVAQKQEEKIKMKIMDMKNRVESDSEIELKTDMSKEDEKINPIKLLFDLKNIKEMFRTIVKKRPNKGRLQITLLIISISIYVSEFAGLFPE